MFPKLLEATLHPRHSSRLEAMHRVHLVKFRSIPPQLHTFAQLTTATAVEALSGWGYDMYAVLRLCTR